MVVMKHKLRSSNLTEPLHGLPGPFQRLSPGRRDLRKGQAYTEYLIILLFGVFLGLGVVVVDRVLPPEQTGIMDRLYGYIFDYYAALANYLNLPCF